jgi:hypothetical protein
VRLAPPEPLLPEDRWCANCRRNVYPVKSVGEQAAFLYALIGFVLGGLVGFAIALLWIGDARLYTLIGAGIGLALVVFVYGADRARCPICRSRNLGAPR